MKNRTGRSSFIGALEAAGGALMIVGWYTRAVSLLLAGEMLVVLIRVKMPGGPIWRVSGYELPMLLAAASFWIFCYGPGPWSADRG